MPYHTPDPRWAIFNAPDFESYAKVFVVEGRFHKDVPEDVVKSYAVAEHIMAHAYYYYPMYEEALVKLLRTLEMAVKMRCEQIGIATTFTVKKKEDKPEEIKPKDLSVLIDQLAKKEPSKSVTDTLHGLRKLRNTFMHPKDNMMFGSMALNAIRHTLVQLNALFLPESFFIEAQKTLELVQKHWQPFEQGLFILDQNGSQIGIYESKVVETYRDGSEWVCLCAFYAIFNDARESLEEMKIPKPLTLVIRQIEIGPGIMQGRNVVDDTPVVLFQTDESEPATVFRQFQAELASVEPANLDKYKVLLASDVERERVKWRCVYWGQ